MRFGLPGPLITPINRLDIIIIAIGERATETEKLLLSQLKTIRTNYFVFCFAPAIRCTATLCSLSTGPLPLLLMMMLLLWLILLLFSVRIGVFTDVSYYHWYNCNCWLLMLPFLSLALLLFSFFFVRQMWVIVRLPSAFILCFCSSIPKCTQVCLILKTGYQTHNYVPPFIW